MLTFTPEVHPEGRKTYLTRAEIAVKLDTVICDTIPFHGEHGADFTGTGVPDGAHLIPMESGVRNIVTNITAETDGGDGQRDDLSDKSVPSVGAGRVHFEAETVLPAAVEAILHGRTAGRRRNLRHQSRRDVVDVTVVQSDGIRLPGLVFGRIDQVKLQQPEAKGFDSVGGSEDLDAIRRTVVVTVVDQNPLFHQHLQRLINLNNQKFKN